MPLATYAHFADRDPLTRLVLEQMLAGRQYAPVGAHARAGRRGSHREERSTSKSAISREFVARTTSICRS